MAFENIETAVENNRLARRLSGNDLKPLKFDLLQSDHPQITFLIDRLKSDSYESFLNEPIGRYQFTAYLKYRAQPPLSHHRMIFLDEIKEFKNTDATLRKNNAQQIYQWYFAPRDLSSPDVQDERSTVESSRISALQSLHDEKELQPQQQQQQPLQTHEHKLLAPGIPVSGSKQEMQPEQDEQQISKGLITVPIELLQQLNQRLLSSDPGEDVFDKVSNWIYEDLKNHHYSNFVKSDDFIKYCQYRQYSSRGGITLESFMKFRVLGRGAFGAVSAVSKLDSNAVYAMKELSKKQIKAQDMFASSMNERNILSELESPFVTKLKYSFQNDQSLFFVMDFASGGDLKWHMRNRGIKDKNTKLRYFTEDETRFYVAETLIAIEHLHSRNIVYRDLKPHNLLLNSKGHVILSDFGLAEKLTNYPDQLLSTLGGTPGYWSPQCLMRVPYGVEADIWSFGVLIYYFLSGQKPDCSCKKGQWCTFVHKDEKQQENLAAEGLKNYNDKIEYSSKISPAALDLLKKIFVVDPRKRITISEMKQHAFFKPLNWKVVAAQHLHPPYVPEPYEVHADGVSEVGDIDDHKFRKTQLDEEDVKAFEAFDYFNERIVQEELAEALLKQYRRFGSAPDLAYQQEQEHREAEDVCCIIL